jgi:hypothetical protein
MLPWRPTPAVALLAVLGGCIKAPEVVIVDRATALEQQAAGSFQDLELRLMRAAATPKPTPLSPDELKALGIRAQPLVDNSEMTDADRVDQLLRQRCLGEGKDGLLVQTPDACRGAADKELMGTLVERVNLARNQLWRWMRERRPERSLEELRASWREAHLRGVVCEGWIERADGKWEAKGC